MMMIVVIKPKMELDEQLEIPCCRSVFFAVLDYDNDRK